jgi:hypothetical protein
LDNCYKAGVEWAEHARSANPALKLEDGQSVEFWSQDSTDYELVAELAEECGLNFRTEYELRQAGIESLHAGCVERWQTLFGGRLKRFTDEEVVKAAEVFLSEPVATVSEPHVVSAPTVQQPVEVPVTTKVSGGPTIISGKKIVILKKAG